MSLKFNESTLITQCYHCTAGEIPSEFVKPSSCSGAVQMTKAQSTNLLTNIFRKTVNIIRQSMALI